MKKGDILELEITSSGMEGEGVARHDGVVVFVPRALVGEKVRVMVKEVRSRFARAGVIKLIEPSPHRVKPVCPVFYKCGSCDMQHIDYGEQLRVKRASVASCLAKTCGREIDVDEVVPSPHIVGYRNKIQAPLGIVGGKLVAGYFAEGTHRVVPFPDGGCAMYDKDMSRLLDVFLTFARERGLTCYDESTRKGLLRHFVARRVGDAYAIVVVINGAKLPHADQLIAAVKREKAKFSLFTCSNTAPTNVILHGKLTRLWGEESLPCNVLGVKAQVGPLSFMQINDEVRDLIYSAAASRAAALDNATVIDAYSGTGMLTNILAKHASRVVGIEIVPEAVADADALTAMNGNEGKVRRARGTKHPVRRRARPAAQGLRQKGRRRAAFRRPRQDRLHLLQPGDPRARRRAADAKVRHNVRHPVRHVPSNKARRDARGARKEKINSIFVRHNIDRAAEIIQKSLGFLYRQEKQTRHRFPPSPSGGGFNVYDLTIIKSPMPEISKATAAPVILFANASCALPNA